MKLFKLNVEKLKEKEDIPRLIEALYHRNKDIVKKAEEVLKDPYVWKRWYGGGLGSIQVKRLEELKEKAIVPVIRALNFKELRSGISPFGEFVYHGYDYSCLLYYPREFELGLCKVLADIGEVDIEPIIHAYIKNEGKVDIALHIIYNKTADQRIVKAIIQKLEKQLDELSRGEKGLCADLFFRRSDGIGSHLLEPWAVNVLLKEAKKENKEVKEYLTTILKRYTDYPESYYNLIDGINKSSLVWKIAITIGKTREIEEHFEKEEML